MAVGKKVAEEKEILAKDASEKYRRFTIAEIIPLVGLGRSTLLNYCRSGRLKATKIAGKWRISQADLDEFLATADPVEEEGRDDVKKKGKEKTESL